jgi:hypothetical protein
MDAYEEKSLEAQISEITTVLSKKFETLVILAESPAMGQMVVYTGSPAAAVGLAELAKSRIIRDLLDPKARQFFSEFEIDRDADFESDADDE